MGPLNFIRINNVENIYEKTKLTDILNKIKGVQNYEIFLKEFENLTTTRLQDTYREWVLSNSKKAIG
jgi:hypothetical protein